MREAAPTFNANPDGGVFIISSSIAGRLTGGSSMPYSVTKAAQLHLMRCLASTQGPKVRVNAVLPGLLMTEWVSCENPQHTILLYESDIKSDLKRGQNTPKKQSRLWKKRHI
jgi:NAD(P)-dependent dehydrogenase (short-subunit alcohol dehydrogenase family)